MRYRAACFQVCHKKEQKKNEQGVFCSRPSKRLGLHFVSRLSHRAKLGQRLLSYLSASIHDFFEVGSSPPFYYIFERNVSKVLSAFGRRKLEGKERCLGYGAYASFMSVRGFFRKS